MRKHLCVKWFLTLLAYGMVTFPSLAEAKLTDVSTALSTQQKKNDVVIVVTDNQEQPLIGAMAVSVEDPSKAGIVGVDGKVTLSVPADGNVRIELMGYKTQTVAIGGRTTFGIVMEDDVIAVDEVVVVGYGVQKKLNLTGSVATVNEDELSLRPVADASSALQGLVPGLTVTSSNASRPGATADIQIRGTGSISGGDSPYVLIDGVEGSLADVNPNDIASISVLKDAAAASIYGSRAAFGVVLVTTKRGNEGKVRVTYQGTVGFTSPTTLPDLANSYDYALFYNQGMVNADGTAPYDADRLATLKRVCEGDTSINPWADLSVYGGSSTVTDNLNGAFGNTIYGYANTDMIDHFYKDYAVKQDHNLSFAGGTEKATYYISMGMYQEDGIVDWCDNMNYRRITLNANTTSKINDWLKIKLNTKFNFSDNQDPFGDNNEGLTEGTYHSLLQHRTHIPIIDPNGNYTSKSYVDALQSDNGNQTKIYNTSITGGLEITPLKNWNIFVDYSLKYTDTQYEALYATVWHYGLSMENMYSSNTAVSGGQYTRSEASNLYTTANIYSNYTFDLGSSHNLVLMGGFQDEDNSYYYLKNTATNLISQENPSLDLAVGDQTIEEERTAWATRGFFGRINYDYKDKYLFEVNGRYDGSSRFDPDNAWGFFPSASIGWNIAKESFMSRYDDTISMLKLRASWGQLGNQTGADLYTYASTMESVAQGTWYFSDGRDMYIKSPGIISGNTTWETVETLNLGLDFSLLRGKITGSVEVFQRDTKDMLGPSVDLPDMFGGDAPDTNNANMRTKGWEFNINYRGKIGQDINFSLGGMIADSKSYITAYENPTGTDPNSNWYVGKEVGEIWGLKASGLLQTQAEADNFNELNTTYLTSVQWQAGDLAYLDLNGDGIINKGNSVLGDMGDYDVIGNTTPRYQYSLNGSISWKGLSLSMLWQGVGKCNWSPSMSTVYFWGSNSYLGMTVFEEHLDYWSEDNRDAYYPRPYVNSAANVYNYLAKTATASDYYMQNAAYIRLKNLTVSYDLPAKFTNKIGIEGVKVFFTGENLLTFTSLSSIFDPEAVFLSNSYTSEAGKNYPINKVCSFGLVINL